MTSKPRVKMVKMKQQELPPEPYEIGSVCYVNTWGTNVYEGKVVDKEEVGGNWSYGVTLVAQGGESVPVGKRLYTQHFRRVDPLPASTPGQGSSKKKNRVYPRSLKEAQSLGPLPPEPFPVGAACFVRLWGGKIYRGEIVSRKEEKQGLWGYTFTLEDGSKECKLGTEFVSVGAEGGADGDESTPTPKLSPSDAPAKQAEQKEAKDATPEGAHPKGTRLLAKNGSWAGRYPCTVVDASNGPDVYMVVFDSSPAVKSLVYSRGISKVLCGGEGEEDEGAKPNKKRTRSAGARSAGATPAPKKGGSKKPRSQAPPPPPPTPPPTPPPQTQHHGVSSQQHNHQHYLLKDRRIVRVLDRSQQPHRVLVYHTDTRQHLVDTGNEAEAPPAALCEPVLLLSSLAAPGFYWVSKALKDDALLPADPPGESPPTLLSRFHYVQPRSRGRSCRFARLLEEKPARPGDVEAEGRTVRVRYYLGPSVVDPEKVRPPHAADLSSRQLVETDEEEHLDVSRLLPWRLDVVLGDPSRVFFVQPVALRGSVHSPGGLTTVVVHDATLRGPSFPVDIKTSSGTKTVSAFRFCTVGGVHYSAGEAVSFTYLDASGMGIVRRFEEDRSGNAVAYVLGLEPVEGAPHALRDKVGKKYRVALEGLTGRINLVTPWTQGVCHPDLLDSPTYMYYGSNGYQPWF